MKSIACFACVLSFTAIVHAQTLAERVPGDAVAYIGWKGADADDGYTSSHMQAIVDASGWANVRDQVIPQVMQKITAQSNDHGEGALAVKTMLNILWRHPSAIFFAGVNSAGTPPGPKVGLICQAGADADALMTIFNAGAHGPGADPTSKAYVVGDCTVFTIGYADEHAIPTDAEKDKSLATDIDFDHMMTATGKDAVITGYANVTRGFSEIDDAVARSPDDTTQDLWPKVRDASGLTDIKHIAYAGMFNGKNWQSQTFVEAPAPRGGLLNVIEPAPMDPALLLRVPATATSSMLGTLNLGEFFTQLRSIASNIPQGAVNFDRAMGVVQMFIGRSLQHDILEPLGPQWAMYSDASIPMAAQTATATQPASPLSGVNLVIVNKLVDPAKALQGWTMLSYAINNALGRFKRGPQPQFHTAMTKNGDDSVFSIAQQFVQFSWTIHDNYLYLGFSADGVSAAANNADSATPPTQVPAFADTARQLMPNAFTGFSFADLPTTISQQYVNMEKAIDMYRKMALQQSITLPEKILPPLDTLKAELTPAVSVSWADDHGYHTKSQTPYPGAAPQPGMAFVGGGALGVSIALPALSRARETANRIKCASNERQIGQALLLYSNDHKGNYPATLGDLMGEQIITAQVCLCPDSNTALPKNIDQMSPEDLKKWVNDHSDYVYVAAGETNQAGADEIMVYEKPSDHGKDGMNILFGDGHVEFVRMGRAVAMIQDQNKTVPGVDLPDVPQK